MIDQYIRASSYVLSSKHGDSIDKLLEFMVRPYEIPIKFYPVRTSNALTRIVKIRGETYIVYDYEHRDSLRDLNRILLNKKFLDLGAYFFAEIERYDLPTPKKKATEAVKHGSDLFRKLYKHPTLGEEALNSEHVETCTNLINQIVDVVLVMHELAHSLSTAGHRSFTAATEEANYIYNIFEEQPEFEPHLRQQSKEKFRGVVPERILFHHHDEIDAIDFMKVIAESKDEVVADILAAHAVRKVYREAPDLPDHIVVAGIYLAFKLVNIHRLIRAAHLAAYDANASIETYKVGIEAIFRQDAIGMSLIGNSPHYRAIKSEVESVKIRASFGELIHNIDNSFIELESIVNTLSADMLFATSLKQLGEGYRHLLMQEFLDKMESNSPAHDGVVPYLLSFSH